MIARMCRAIQDFAAFSLRPPVVVPPYMRDFMSAVGGLMQAPLGLGLIYGSAQSARAQKACYSTQAAALQANRDAYRQAMGLQAGNPYLDRNAR